MALEGVKEYSPKTKVASKMPFNAREKQGSEFLLALHIASQCDEEKYG